MAKPKGVDCKGPRGQSSRGLGFQMAWGQRVGAQGRASAAEGQGEGSGSRGPE